MTLITLENVFIVGVYKTHVCKANDIILYFFDINITMLSGICNIWEASCSVMRHQ